MSLTLPPVPAVWLFVGDSITHGCLHTDPDRNYVEHLNERIRWDHTREPDILLNTAVSGWTVPDLLANWDRYAGRYGADIAVVMLGTNDARAGADGVAAYKEGLTEIVDRFQRDGATVVLQVPPPVHEEPSGREGIEGYREAVRELGAERGLIVVDHARAWDADEVDDLLADHIHPNAAGHLRMSETFLATTGLARERRQG